MYKRISESMGGALCKDINASTPSLGNYHQNRRRNNGIQKMPLFKTRSGSMQDALLRSVDPASLPQPIPLAHRVKTDLRVIAYMRDRLSPLIYNEDQLVRLASMVLDSLVKLETDRETPEEQRAVDNFLYEDSNFDNLLRKPLESGALFYHDMVDRVRKHLKPKDGKFKQGTLSRIYHFISNVKQNDIPTLRSTYYKRQNGQAISIRDEQVAHYVFEGVVILDEMVRLEEVAIIGRRMGEKTNIVLTQIAQQTKKVSTMLKDTPFKQWKYNLSDKQVLQVAAIAKTATEISYDGVIILLGYLRQSMNELDRQGMKMPQIEALMLKAVNVLAKLYPPGEGLEKHPEEVKQALASLEKKGKDKGQFKHDPTVLSGSDEQRTRQLRESILHYASIAKKHQEKFEDMISRTCLKRAVSVLTGLKLNPSKPNEKALLRIQEKIFFTGEEYNQKVDPTGKSMEEILKEEETCYEKELGKLLSTKNEVTFAVSDMVRGKCTFVSISDIVQTVKDLKEYCATVPGFNIIQVESRFTRKVPISDVSLKIVIDNEIVSELQLTLQTNAAAYHFAHIVYEVARSKIFTKSKMVDNMFRENEERLGQVINRALQLKGKGAIPADKHSQIRQVFGVEQQRSKTWDEAIDSAMQSNDTLKTYPHLNIALRPEADMLMVAVSTLQQKCSKEQILRTMQGILSMNTLIFVKTVALQELFLCLDIAGDIKSGYFVNFWQYVQDLLHIDVEFFVEVATNSNILNYYIRQLSSCIAHNSIFYKGLSREEQEPNGIFIDHVVGPNRACNHQLKLLTQLLEVMGHYQTKEFELYSGYLIELLNKQSQGSEYRRFLPQLKLRTYQKAITRNTITDKQCQDFKDLRLLIIKSEILLVEWQLWNTILELVIGCKNRDSSVFKKYQENYQKVVDLSKINLVDLSSIENAMAHCLIARQIQATQGMITEQEAAHKACEEHYSYVVNCEITPSLAFKFNLAQIFQKHKALKEKVKPNLSVVDLEYNSEPNFVQVVQNLIYGKWSNLKSLSLDSDKISGEACYWLSQSDWPSIDFVNLTNNQIAGDACKWLAQAKWPKLRSLTLSHNQVGDQGCIELNKGNWKHLKTIYLDSNHIGPQGCQGLAQSEWPEIQELNICFNQVGDDGVHFLTQSNWPKLKKLDLTKNNIGDRGCQFLSQSKWPAMQNLKISSNQIADYGAAELAKMKWPRLIQFDVSRNSISDHGIQQFVRSDWPSLKKISMSWNRLQSTDKVVRSWFSHRNIKTDMTGPF